MNVFNSIETLLMNKNFSELTKEEKSLILKNMTAEEYNEQRLLIKSSQQLFKIELPAAPSSEVILNRAKIIANNTNAQNSQENHSSVQTVTWSNRLMALLNIKIPAWQVAMAAIVVGIMLFPIFDRDKINTDVATPYVAIIDTVSEQLINPMLNNKDSNFFAIGAKLIDSNYMRVSNYNRRRQQKDVHTEMLLSLTPIEL